MLWINILIINFIKRSGRIFSRHSVDVRTEHVSCSQISMNDAATLEVVHTLQHESRTSLHQIHSLFF